MAKLDTQNIFSMAFNDKLDRIKSVINKFLLKPIKDLSKINENQ